MKTGADEEAFEDNAEEYITRDLEGSGMLMLHSIVQTLSLLYWIIPPGLTDIDTRRRAACDLVRGLCKFFEGPVTGIFSGYVNSMLTEYAKNPGVIDR